MNEARFNNLVKVNPENADELYAKARSDAENVSTTYWRDYQTNSLNKAYRKVLRNENFFDAGILRDYF